MSWASEQDLATSPLLHLRPRPRGRLQRTALMVEYSLRDPHLRSNYDPSVDAKIVIMGNTGVGKTSLLHRYTQNKFEPKNTTSTTGAFFVTKKVYVHGTRVRLQLWDTAGQERFRSMVSWNHLRCLAVVRHLTVRN